MADPWQMRTDMADQMRTEMEVLSQVQHVNIVPLLGWSKDGRAPCLVYTFMEGDSGITATHMQTEHVLDTQVYMSPEY
jgi:hypothetical protein